VTPAEAGATFGWAESTSRNNLYLNLFPVRTVRFMQKKMVKVADLKDFVDRLEYEDEHQNNKLGAPKKSIQIANKKSSESAQMAKGGV
jgi:hypothetical protein